MHALATTLKTIFPENTSASKAVLICDYSDTDQFNQLWDLLKFPATALTGRDNPFCALVSHDPVCIIIANNAPPGDLFHSTPKALQKISLIEHFTAASWVSAFRLQFDAPSTKIIVVDPSPSGSASSLTQTLAILLRAKTGENEYLLPNSDYLLSPSLTDLVDHISKPNATQSQKERQQALLLLKTTLLDALTGDRENHHSISNIISAYLLLASVLSEDILASERASNFRDPIQLLLISLLRACGMTYDGARNEQSWLSKNQYSSCPNVVLIDDMSRLWTPLLHLALGFNKRKKDIFRNETEMFHEHLRGLPDRLSHWIKSEANFLTLAECAIAGPDIVDAEQNFILFLDLRLFSQSNNQSISQEECTYINQLAKVGLELLDSDRKCIWLDSAEYLRFREECEYLSTLQPTDSSNASSLGRLTLLPRIFALLDPTQPIVIFSSTHRSDVTQVFGSYKNIITEFRKPTLDTLMGYCGSAESWHEGVEEVKKNFNIAITKANRIIQIRKHLKKLNTVKPILSVPSQNKDGHNVVEIFIDESGYRDSFSIGAVVLLAESQEALVQFHQKLEANNLHWGISDSNKDRYIQENSIPTINTAYKRLEAVKDCFVHEFPQNFSFLEKNSDEATMQDKIDQICRLAQEDGIQIFSASLAHHPNAAIPYSSPVTIDADPVAYDAQIWQLTSRLIKVLFTAHPDILAACQKQDFTLSVDMGVRTIERGEQQVCENLFQQFGIKYTDQNLSFLDPDEIKQLRRLPHYQGNFKPWRPIPKTISINSDYPLPLIRATFAEIRLPFAVPLHRCRAVSLMDFSELREDVHSWQFKYRQGVLLPKQVHYLADWVARQNARAHRAATDAGPDSRDCLTTLLDRGFSDQWTVRTEALLEIVIASKTMNKQAVIHKLNSWLNEYSDFAYSENSAEKLLLAYLSGWATKLNASDFDALFR